MPIQNADILPDTIPERIVNEEPPSLEAVTTSSVCLAFGEVKIFVNSGIKAAPNVPQEMIAERISHKLLPISANNQWLTPNVIAIDRIDVNQTRLVNGFSKSNLSVLAA